MGFNLYIISFIYYVETIEEYIIFYGVQWLKPSAVSIDY